MSSPLISPQANAKYDLSCKEDADDRDNEIWKCNFAVPQSFLNYSESLCLKSVLTIREIDWCEPIGDEKNAQIFQQVFTSSTQLQKKKKRRGKDDNSQTLRNVRKWKTLVQNVQKSRFYR